MLGLEFSGFSVHWEQLQGCLDPRKFNNTSARLPSEVAQHPQVAAWFCPSVTMSKALPHFGPHFPHLYNGYQCQLTHRLILGFHEIPDVRDFTKAWYGKSSIKVNRCHHYYYCYH